MLSSSASAISRTVTPSEIRDFRGAMQGRTDKGIFITTSGFTKAVVEEATRDGAPQLELIHGERLVELLRAPARYINQGDRSGGWRVVLEAISAWKRRPVCPWPLLDCTGVGGTKHRVR